MAYRKRTKIRPAEYHCCCCFCFRRFTDNREPDDFFPVKQSRLETYQRFVKVTTNYLKIDTADLNPTNKAPAFPGFAVSSVCSNCVERIRRVCLCHERFEAAKIAIEYEIKTLIQELDREEYKEMRNNDLITKFDDVRRVLLFNDAFHDSGSKLSDYPKVRVDEASMSLNSIVKPSSSEDIKQEVDSPPSSVMDGETLNPDADDVPKAAKSKVIPSRSAAVTGTSALSTPPKPTTVYVVSGMKKEVKQETPKVTLPIGSTGHQRVMCKLKNIKTGKTFLGVVAQSQVFPSNRLATNTNQKQLKVVALKSDNNPKPIKSQLKKKPKLQLICTLPECCCGKEFTTVRGRKSHERSQRQMYSKICQNVAESPSELDDTLPELASSPPFTCDKRGCEMKLPSKIEWKAHYLFHCMRPEDGPASVNKLKLFYKHLVKMARKFAKNKLRKRPQTLRCEFCPARFHRKISFDCHMKVHSEFPAPCSFCQETFDQPAELLAHEVSHIPEAETDTNEKLKYMCCPCPRCDLVCKSKSLLETHFYRKHLKITWKAKINSGYRCADCGNRRFDKALKYINHRQNFHGEDGQRLKEQVLPILCPHAKCGQRFRGKLGLRLHQQTFHGPKGHRPINKCHICQRTYRSRRNYETHMRGHARPNDASNDNVVVAPTDQKSYLCQSCGKSFHWEGLLLNHIREVHSENLETNVCHLCGEIFPVFRLLRAHLKKNHKDANKDN